MESAIRDEAFNHERALYALSHATLEDVRFADAPSGRNPYARETKLPRR